MANGNIIRGDTDNVHRSDTCKLCSMAHPRTAMYAERIAHVIGMIVEHNHVERARGKLMPSRRFFQQKETEMMEVAASQNTP